jgi:cyanophycinase
MPELQAHFTQLTTLSSIQYPVMVIGGAEDKVNECEILTAFFENAGAANATLGIIPCASREPNLVGDRYYQIFTGMGAKQVQILDIRHPDECDEVRWLEILSQCTGIFVTGGDQLRLCHLISGSKLLEQIRTGVDRGRLVLAGTSAGAAMMGATMIAGGSSGESPNPALVELAPGLGIIPEMLIDQHFHNRNRMARLLSAIAAHPSKLGIGIDEDTCIALDQTGILTVLGKGSVTIVDPSDLIPPHPSDAIATNPFSLHNLKLHILSKGDRYNYKNRIVL